MKKFFLCAAVAMLALVGCEKQNQSSLDFDQVEKAATVSGTLVAYVNNPKTATATLPLEGIRLYISVPSDKYVDGAAGIQEFETKTAADGSFSITIKTGSKTIQGAKLRSDDFKYGFPTGDTLYYQYVDVALDDLNDKDIRLEYVVAKEDQVLNQTVGEGQIKGILTYDAGTVEMPDKSHENAQVAAANALLEAVVTYFKGDANEVKKKFVATTNAQGEFTFNIPAQSAGNEFDINVPQFKGKYTEFKNNKWVTVDAYYSKEKLVTGKKVKPAETLQLKATETQLLAADRAEIEPTTKEIKMTVKGKISKEYEKMISKDDKDQGPERGLTPYKEGKLVIEAFNSELNKSIFFDATTDDKGEYEKQIALYDSWNLAKVTIKVYTQGEFTETITHYFLGYTTEDDYYRVKINSWYGKFAPQSTEENQKSTQKIEGTYKTDAAVEAKPSLFFDVKMPELELAFTPANKAEIKGVNEKIDVAEKLVTYDSKPAEASNVKLYSDGIKLWELPLIP
jgi:hypothetical protein